MLDNPPVPVPESPLRTTPLHPRTQALCRTFRWRSWNGFALVCAYIDSVEEEYYALHNRAGLLDRSALRKLDVQGPDAAALLSRLCTRDAQQMDIGQVRPTAWTDDDGTVVDVGTVARLSDHHFRLTGSGRWYDWVLRHKGSLMLEVHDPSDEWSTVGLQGPLAWRIVSALCPQITQEPVEESVVLATVRGSPVWLSRHTGNRYEVEVATEGVLLLWDTILEIGEPQGLIPCGLDALDVLRVEAGLPMLNVDFRDCTPQDAGLREWVDAERSVRFLGQDTHKSEVSTWSTVAVEITWEHLESLYASYGQTPTLLPKVSGSPVPLYDRDGRAQVGQITSATWSPLLKTHIAIAQVRHSHRQPGTRLRAEHTVAFERRQLPCVVVQLPWASTAEQAPS